MYDFAEAQHALRRRAARRRRRRLARGPRQRRARRHGRGEARQHRLLRSAASTTSPTWRSPRATARPSAWARAQADDLLRALRGRVVDRRTTSLHADSLDDPGNEKIQQKHWIGVDADGGRADRSTAAPSRAWRRSTTARRRWRGARRRASAATRPLQPRPVPHRLRRRPDGRGRADDLLAQHRDPGRRRGQLRPPRRRAAEALHRRRRRADVRRARPTRRRRPTSSPARCRRSCRRRTSTPRPRDKNIDRCWTLPLDVHAGVGPLRHRVAGRAPAARRAAGPRPRRARRSCRSCRRRRRSPARTSGSATGALELVQRVARRQPLHDDGRHRLARRSSALAIGHTLPRGSQVESVTLDGSSVDWQRARRPTAASRSRSTGRTPRRARRVVVDARALSPARPSHVVRRAPSAPRRSRPGRGWRAGPARPSPRAVTA